MFTQPEARAYRSDEAHFLALTKASHSPAVALTCDPFSAKAILHFQCQSVSTSINHMNRAERCENWFGEKDPREEQAAKRTYVTVFPSNSHWLFQGNNWGPFHFQNTPAVDSKLDGHPSTRALGWQTSKTPINRIQGIHKLNWKTVTNLFVSTE